jgi:hypothetical protein
MDEKYHHETPADDRHEYFEGSSDEELVDSLLAAEEEEGSDSEDSCSDLPGINEQASSDVACAT